MRGRHRVRHFIDWLFLFWIALMTGAALFLLLILAGTVAAQGLSPLAAALLRGGIAGAAWRGVVPALADSLLVVGIGAAAAVPVGLGAGFYLSECSGLRMASVIRATADGLSGVPSIVAGLMIYAAVVTAMGRVSALAGGLALATLLAPTLARATEQTLLTLPYGLREGARALGATRAQTLIYIMLPTAGRRLVARVLLALARAMGETAPLLFTAFGAVGEFHGSLSSVAPLPVAVFVGAVAHSAAGRAQAWSAALALLVTVFALYAGARLCAPHAG